MLDSVAYTACKAAAQCLNSSLLCLRENRIWYFNSLICPCHFAAAAQICACPNESEIPLTREKLLLLLMLPSPSGVSVGEFTLFSTFLSCRTSSLFLFVYAEEGTSFCLRIVEHRERGPPEWG